jgi:hypothetical protein
MKKKKQIKKLQSRVDKMKIALAEKQNKIALLETDIRKLISGTWLEKQEVKTRYSIKNLIYNTIWSGEVNNYHLAMPFYKDDTFEGLNLGFWSFTEDYYKRNTWRCCVAKDKKGRVVILTTFWWQSHTPRNLTNDDSRNWSRPPYFIKYPDSILQFLMNEPQRSIVQNDINKPKRCSAFNTIHKLLNLGKPATAI